MDIETQVSDQEGPGQRVKEHDLVEAKASHEKTLDLTGPFSRRAIRERGWRLFRRSARWKTRSGNELSVREELRSLSRKPPMCTWNDDEPNWTERIEFLPKLRRDGDRGMQDEPPVVESKHRHANRDRDQASLPAELMLDAPEVGVVLD